MHFRRFHSLVALLGLLMFASANAAIARDLKYPTDAPVFTFQVPDGWNVYNKGGVSKALWCNAKDGSSLHVQLYSIADEEIGADYRKFAEVALRVAKVRDIEVVKVDEKTLKHGQKTNFVRSTFTDPQGTPYVSLIVFLPMGSDQTCAIHCFLPMNQVDSHQQEMEAMLNSIQPLG